jgi:hypothetical protein
MCASNATWQLYIYIYSTRIYVNFVLKCQHYYVVVAMMMKNGLAMTKQLKSYANPILRR